MIIEEEKMTLQGRELVLRCPVEEDAAMLIEYLKVTCSETRFLVKEPEEIQMTVEEEIDFIQKNRDSERDLMILGFLDGEYVGNCSLMGMYPKRYQHRVLAGIALYQKFTGMGIGQRMLQKLIMVAKNLGLEQMELEVHADNQMAIHLYEKLGFVKTGTYPRDMKYLDGSYADAFYMVKNLIQQTWIMDSTIYTEKKLLGKGKGGYSYLVTDGEKQFVLKQLHHEPCSYYEFGDKLEAELVDYKRLKDLGLPIPELIGYDKKAELLLKEYVEGETIEEYVKQNKMQPEYIQQVETMAVTLKEHQLNIDYYPTNFIVRNHTLYYVDYECNDYMEEWNFENWGKQYWIHKE